MNHLHIHRLFLEPKQSYFLFGPRGTGKSTLAESRHPPFHNQNYIILMPVFTALYDHNPY